MPDLKQRLTELIDAYSVARATGNQLLIQSAATALVSFLEGVEITAPTPGDDGGQE